MNIGLFSLTLITFILIIHYFGKKSIVSLNFNFWSLLFYKEMFFIIPSIFFISIYGVESFRTFVLAKPEMENITSWVVLYCVMSFITCMIFFSFIGITNTRFVAEPSSFTLNDRRDIVIFGSSAMFTAVTLLLIAILFLNYKHAFIYTIFSSDNLIKVRLENTYYSMLPSQASYLISISTFISTIFSVYLFKINNKKLGYITLIISLFLATSEGSKGDIMNLAVVTFVAYFYFFKPKVNLLKLLVVFVFFISLSSVLLFHVVSLQVPDLSVERFFLYLVERIGVDQMAGTYETFSAELYSPKYAWHAVPFSHFFVDYNIFSKDLMLLSEGGTHTSVGVKNSLFISEAFGMGSWELAIVSPFIFSFGYVIKLLIIYSTLTILFSKSVSQTFTLPLLFTTTKLTGDFSSVVLQKGTILLLVVFVVIYLVSLLLNFFIKNYSS
ncbi:hypothetical protein H4J51_07195 [Colwellia sp. MB02u-18]|uniref:hypothetical protein n=1 Tax=unclassified Colwellia TaxID=196834 RepID=UPI0015F4C869|nr:MULTISPECIES: hypothetical protein [unclassified Colwellia]MBA6222889.1 hypothetical protein [Colwellia sp. MB3u-45]MBA6267828.1 hypothetical protein [Colwellia sp. MB3u-43]MBA6322365.1 hypothetical protein [Colwellia sp. MB02u-19]MBA6324364.1 hypothetical protein [Colwellia sp. MB02u-18]MBA6332520.1 hypothetical protein [Colwellia sp. MB02u-12]